MKFGRVRKTIRARCNYIQLDYFYMEVDYYTKFVYLRLPTFDYVYMRLTTFTYV